MRHIVKKNILLISLVFSLGIFFSLCIPEINADTSQSQVTGELIENSSSSSSDSNNDEHTTPKRHENKNAMLPTTGVFSVTSSFVLVLGGVVVVIFILIKRVKNKERRA